MRMMVMAVTLSDCQLVSWPYITIAIQHLQETNTEDGYETSLRPYRHLELSEKWNGQQHDNQIGQHVEDANRHKRNIVTRAVAAGNCGIPIHLERPADEEDLEHAA